MNNKQEALMRKKILAVTFLICLAVTGCGNASQSTNDMVSIEEYNKVVDERDYYKEQYEKLTSQQSEPDIPTDSSAAADTSSDIISETSTNTDIGFNYYINNLSNDEIISECLSLLSNVPENGQTIEQYTSTFKNAPLSTDINEYLMYYYFTDNYDPRKNFPTQNAIIRVSGNGIGTQMDGTLAKRDDQSPFMEIELCITDYDTASAIYDKLFNELSPIYRNVNDSRNGTKWHASAWYEATVTVNGTTSTYGMGIDSFISLEKLDSGYLLIARKDCQ